MKRSLEPADLRIWAVVASTVRPLPGRAAPQPPKGPAAASPGLADAAPKVSPARGRPTPHRPPEDVELGLRRRISRGREPLAASIDLHGMTYDVARASLNRFVLAAVEEGWRSVLVITGKGMRGDGVLRRSVPDWLGEPPLRAHVAGISEAHRRHGGEGALYIALKHRPRA